MPEAVALWQAHDVARTESTLRDLKGALGPVGIPFIVLKGVHLGAVYYPRPEDRPHQDIDVLVPPPEFDRACEVLTRAGFERMAPLPDRSATEREFYNYAFTSRAGFGVEVHRDWAGYGRYPIDAKGLFERAVPFSYGKTKVLGLAPEDLLLHLCVHQAKGYFASHEFKHVKDLGVLLTGHPVDWPVFLARARAARCRIGAYYALLSAREQCAAPVPQEVLDDLRPAAWRRGWIERTLAPGKFPLCVIPYTRMGRIQARLALPLLDRPSDWIPVLARFLNVRIEDWLVARRS